MDARARGAPDLSFRPWRALGRAVAATSLATLALTTQQHAAAGSARSDSSINACTRAPPRTAAQQDRLLRFVAIVKDELEASGSRLAIVARKGTDLSRFGLRYSHAGLSLAAGRGGPWSVRQLYYACDERRPRVYDEGLAGFLTGTDDPALSYLSIVLLPHEPAAVLERAALNDALALRLLGATYSANAYALATAYQNCNQWLIELLAVAWGSLDGPAASAEQAPREQAAREQTTRERLPTEKPLRERAQRWLAEQRYAPEAVNVNSHVLMAAAPFVPFVHLDDHPEDDRYALRVRTSLPSSIERFVRERVPGAARIELCHDEHKVVIRRGWQALDEGCVPAAGDRVVAFD